MTAAPVSSYRVRLVDSYPELRGWLVWPDEADQGAATVRKCAETGETVMMFAGPPHRASFMWVCPGCGELRAGLLAAQPVSGWENPRWVRTGTPTQPTLLPSLGCTAWRRGTCPNGHWWLRDGELIPA